MIHFADFKNLITINIIPVCHHMLRSFLSGGRDNVVTVWDAIDLKKHKTIPVYEVNK